MARSSNDSSSPSDRPSCIKTWEERLRGAQAQVEQIHAAGHTFHLQEDLDKLQQRLNELAERVQQIKGSLDEGWQGIHSHCEKLWEYVRADLERADAKGGESPE